MHSVTDETAVWQAVGVSDSRSSYTKGSELVRVWPTRIVNWTESSQVGVNDKVAVGGQVAGSMSRLRLVDQGGLI